MSTRGLSPTQASGAGYSSSPTGLTNQRPDSFRLRTRSMAVWKCMSPPHAAREKDAMVCIPSLCTCDRNGLPPVFWYSHSFQILLLLHFCSYSLASNYTFTRRADYPGKVILCVCKEGATFLRRGLTVWPRLASDSLCSSGWP